MQRGGGRGERGGGRGERGGREGGEGGRREEPESGRKREGQFMTNPIHILAK